jgi:diguanylate cyclase (GGDEF)-like protein
VKNLRFFLQLGAALVSLATLVLLLAMAALDSVPGHEAARQERLRQATQMLAIHGATLADGLRAGGDAAAAQRAFAQLVAATPVLAGAELVSAAGPTALLSAGTAPGAGAPLEVPLLQRNGHPWGVMRTWAQPATRPAWLRVMTEPGFLLPLAFAAALLPLFMLYLRRVLRQLDPAQVIPSRVQNAFDVMGEGVVMTDDRGHVVLVNKAMTTSQPLAVGTVLSAQKWITDALGAEAAGHPWHEAVARGSSVAPRNIVVHAQAAEERHLVVRAAPVLDANGRARGCLVTFDDTTALHQAQLQLQKQNEELRRLATRDPLTGCLNRRAFLEQFQQLFDTPADGGQACIMVDIDHFKRINDTYGHPVGDSAIQSLARCLGQHLRTQDLLARFGGEEFCIALPGLDDAQAEATAERLCRAIERECGAGVRDVPGLVITASLGVAVRHAGSASPAQLIEAADQALYQAKRGGRNRAVLAREAEPTPA